MIDFQKQRVYNWENKYIIPLVSTKIQKLDFLKLVLNYIWDDLGYECQPNLFVNELRSAKSTGNRYEINLTPNMANEFTLIHELAHSINMKEDFDAYDGHGPNYVADYAMLLTRYYKLDKTMLIGTMSMSKVKMNMGRFSAYDAMTNK